MDKANIVKVRVKKQFFSLQREIEAIFRDKMNLNDESWC